MKMTIKEALAILNVEPGQATPETIKKAFRRAAQKYHPDLNPSGTEMMKLINIAYEVLQGFEGQVEESKVPRLFNFCTSKTATSENIGGPTWT